MSQLFAWGGQSFGVSASASVLPMNTQDWSPLGLTGWISLQSKGLSRVFSSTTVQKHQFFSAQLSSQSNSYIRTWPLEKNIALTRRTFVGKVISLLFNMLSRMVITFLPRSKRLLISRLQSPSSVILVALVVEKVKEESEKAGLKLNIQKTKMASGPITSWEINGETVVTVSDFILLGSKITADGDCSHEIKRRLLQPR